MNVIAALREEESKLDRKMATIRKAINELSDDSAPVARRKKKFSKATLAKMSRTMKLRWAEKKKSQGK